MSKKPLPRGAKKSKPKAKPAKSFSTANTGFTRNAYGQGTKDLVRPLAYKADRERAKAYGREKRINVEDVLKLALDALLRPGTDGA